MLYTTLHAAALRGGYYSIASRALLRLRSLAPREVAEALAKQARRVFWEHPPGENQRYEVLLRRLHNAITFTDMARRMLCRCTMRNTVWPIIHFPRCVPYVRHD